MYGSDVKTFLRELGAKQIAGKERFVLDRFSSDFFLIYDAEEGAGCRAGSLDVYAGNVGTGTGLQDKVLIGRELNREEVIRLMYGLGVNTFQESTRVAMANYLHKGA